MTQVLLVGNPNCGKTTLFNALTGTNQRVGNWPGVTVEKKTGAFSCAGRSIAVTDLPGLYSLTSSASGSQDEQIAAKAIAALDFDLLINVIDACHLERHLYLTSQLLELGKPMIVALNMTDLATERGIRINIEALSQQLNCAIFPLQAHKKMGIATLIASIKEIPPAAKPLHLNLSLAINAILSRTQQQLKEHHIPGPLSYYYACRLLEGDTYLVSTAVNVALPSDEKEIDVHFADARYQKIHEIVKHTQQKNSDTSEHFTAKLDRIILHRYLALPIFFLVMYLMFLFAINIGGAFQDFFDITTDTLFVQGSAWLLQQFHAPHWLIAVVSNGVGKGINTVLTFVPVISAMFFFLAMLETSGYMARAAFVVDRVMRAMGLPGKAFVPMIVGFGCNVPAIMAARTLDSERERLLTILMSPFMSCSARLAIYTVFVAAFFPHGGQNIVFSLYLLGILMAILTGFILRKTLLQGQASPLILELPAYHRPSLRRLLKETSLRLRHFVIRAGRLIIPVCIILGGLNALTISGTLSGSEASSQSLLSLLGQGLTPLFAPMGLQQNNWPATVGLLTGMLAKEVVVGSLNSLYSQLGDPLGQLASLRPFDVLHGLQLALNSIGQNLTQLGQALFNPLLASAPTSELTQSVYGMMAERFDGKVGAYAYLLFILLYVPCVSTMAVIRQEAGSKLMWFSIIWSFIVAYAAAVLFYQVATFSSHPPQSLRWIFGLMLFIGLMLVFLYQNSNLRGQRHALTNS